MAVPTAFRCGASSIYLRFILTSGIVPGRIRAPAPGYRGNGEGALWNVGSNGYSWSSSVSGTNGLYLHFDATNLYPSTTAHRGHGFQVRCLQHLPALYSDLGQCSGQDKGRPAPGYRDFGRAGYEGVAGGVGAGGYTWCSSVVGQGGEYLHFDLTSFNPSRVNGRAHGFSVRCLQHLLALCSVPGQ